VAGFLGLHRSLLFCWGGACAASSVERSCKKAERASQKHLMDAEPEYEIGSSQEMKQEEGKPFGSPS
jgi:hypothetical protein